MATPLSSIVLGDMMPELRAMKYTKAIERIAPDKAAKEVPESPRRLKWIPVTIAMVTPRDAPLATPRVKGVARGLRNRA